MPSILFVDDDHAILQTMERMFRLWSKGTISVKCCSNVGAALDLLGEGQFDVAITDLCMPVITGTEFVKMLVRYYPAVGRVVMSGYPEEFLRISSLKTDPTTLFLVKPQTSEEFKSFFATIESLLKLSLNGRFFGTVREVALGDILQIYCLNSSSVELIVSGHCQGTIRILNGALQDAQVGELRGFEALYKLLSMESGRFESFPLKNVPERTLTESWEKLLLKCAQDLDESNGDEGLIEIKALEPMVLDKRENPITFDHLLELESSESVPENQMQGNARESPPHELTEVVISDVNGSIVVSKGAAQPDLRCDLLEFLEFKGKEISKHFVMGGLQEVVLTLEDGLGIGVFDKTRRGFASWKAAPESVFEVKEQLKNLMEAA